jgi:transcriptional regulator with XRE-family HTH domain
MHLDILDGDDLVITAAQMRAARALLGVDQKTLAAMAGVSVPTIQRMEASTGNVRGIVDSLTKVVDALNAAGIEIIAEGAVSAKGGRGVRLRTAEKSAIDHRETAETNLAG